MPPGRLSGVPGLLVLLPVKVRSHAQLSHAFGEGVKLFKPSRTHAAKHIEQYAAQVVVALRRQVVSITCGVEFKAVGVKTRIQRSGKERGRITVFRQTVPCNHVVYEGRRGGNAALQDEMNRVRAGSLPGDGDAVARSGGQVDVHCKGLRSGEGAEIQCVTAASFKGYMPSLALQASRKLEVLPCTRCIGQ